MHVVIVLAFSPVLIKYYISPSSLVSDFFLSLVFFFGLFFFIVARYDSFLAKTVVRLSTRLCRRLHCAPVRLHYFRLYLCFLASCTCLFLPVCVFRYTFCLVMYRVNSVVMAVCSFPWYICVLRVTRHLWPFWFSFRRLYSAAQSKPI